MVFNKHYYYTGYLNCYRHRRTSDAEDQGKENRETDETEAAKLENDKTVNEPRNTRYHGNTGPGMRHDQDVY